MWCRAFGMLALVVSAGLSLGCQKKGGKTTLPNTDEPGLTGTISGTQQPVGDSGSGSSGSFMPNDGKAKGVGKVLSAFAMSGLTPRTNAASLTLSWATAAVGATYEVVVASDVACAKIVAAYPGLTGTSFTTAPLADGAYFVCMIAKALSGATLQATNSGFAVAIKATPPGPFAITGPAAPVTPAPAVTWTSSATAAVYTVKVASDSACLVALQTFAGGAATTQALTLLPAGTYYVCVTAADAFGNIRAAANSGFPFTVNPPPTLSAVAPVSGIIWGKAPVTLTGTNFAAGATVAFGAAACTDVAVVSATSITCRTPAAAAGATDVIVANADTQQAVLPGSYAFQEFAYTPNYNDNTVSGFAVDPVSGVLTPVGPAVASPGNPMSTTLDPLGRFVYAANASAANVSAYTIDPSTGALTAVPGSPFACGGQPNGGVIDPGGRFLYIANAGAGTIHGFTIDPATGALAPIAGTPWAAAGNAELPWIHPNGKYLYVGAYNNSMTYVYTIDQTSGVLTPIVGSPFAAGSNPAYASGDPAGRFFYTANYGGASVSAFTIDAATGALVQVAGSPFAAGAQPDGLAFDSAGKFLYVANAGGNSLSTYAIDQATGALTPLPGGPVAVGATPGGIATDSSGKFVYVPNSGSNTISGFTLNVATGALVPILGSPFTTGNAPDWLVVY